MKLIKIFGHPVMLICLFLIALVSGESFGGFYALYILMGLPQGVMHSVVGAIAVALLILSSKLPLKIPFWVRSLLYFISDALILLSFFRFFQITDGYYRDTFHQTAPLISFGLLIAAMICNLILAVIILLPPSGKQSSSLNIVS